MSPDSTGGPPSRGTALARLLVEALKSRAKPAGHGEASPCPDAEILAAYADHGLAEEEMARWESHFADCDRCQKIIAVLAASGEALTSAPLTAEEVQKLGTLAAASAASDRGVRNAVAPWIAIWRRPLVWRLLVPAVGLASAVLWFALRQAPPAQILMAQRKMDATATQTETVRRAIDVSPAKSEETQIAQANPPAPPPASPRSGARLRDKEALQVQGTLDAARQTARKQEPAQGAAQEPLVSQLDKLETRGASAKDDRALSSEADKKSQTSTSASAAPVAPAAAPPAPPPAANEERAGTREFDRAAGLPAPAQMKALAQPANPVIVFASPDRKELWRVGPGGRIEHSSDQGQTWQPQASGVTSDLLAGAAPSGKIAWAAGRGVVLRTEDGEHWQSVTPRAPATNAVAPSAPDWIGVQARDALRATITSRDLRRFTTEDGGRTWAPAQ